MHPSSNTTLKYLLFFIFSLSGFSGLIYESIWTHYIKLLLGHAAYAQTLVLAIFMGGMAIGAAIAARKIKSIKNPLLAYAIAEAIIGLFALFFHNTFISTELFLHESLIPALNSTFLIEASRWSIASLLILPQSILLGATFPLISSAIIRLDKKHSGSILGMLYFTNSIGAAIGVLVSAFILINLVGLPGTVLTAGLINLFIALTAWGLSKKINLQNNDHSAEKQATTTSNNNYQIHPNLLLLIASLTGLASFFYEIGWIRMLSQVLGSSMQAFELMLSAFITGIALGSLWIKKRIEHTSSPGLLLGKVQILMGLCAIATLPLYSQMFDFMGFLIKSLDNTDEGYILFNLGSHFIAMLIMLPATFMAGMTLPLITFSLLKMHFGEGSIGKVYAFNTIGAIIGILAAVHIMMPLVGTRGLIIAGATVDIALGLYLVNHFFVAKSKRLFKFAITLTLSLFFIIVFTSQFDLKTLSSGVYRHGTANQNKTSEILYYQDGKTASISVIQTSKKRKIIATNGKPDAAIAHKTQPATGDELTMIALAAFPLAIHPEAKTLANIGMGSGLTTHVLLSSPILNTVDTIEIEPAVIEGIKQFGSSTSNALNDDRSNIIIDDAKAFFSRNKIRYDIIVSEPSNPWISGVSGLFSTEFYRHINRYLKNDGILVQWLQLYETNLTLIDSVIKALGENFNDYAIYSSGDTDIIIVASNQRNLTNLDNRIFNSPSFSQQLERVNIKTIQDLSVRLIATKSTLHPYLNMSLVQPNSDYFPFLSLRSPKALYLKQTAYSLTDLHLIPFPPAGITHKIINKNPEGTQFKPDRQKRLAQLLADLLLDKTELANIDHIISEKILLQISVIKNTLKSCQSNQFKLFDKSLFQLAEKTFATLDSTDMKIFWQTLVSNQCLREMPVQTQQWIKLYAAIANDQYNNTIQLVNNILTHHQPENINKLYFSLAASSSAYIKTQQITKGKRDIEIILSHIKNKIEFPLYVKILLSQLGLNTN